ncbi:MAG: ERF family protein [Acutalibacteraceae bacterium]|nr:ERF family protein [Acutalibacteraceae bacterium]
MKLTDLQKAVKAKKTLYNAFGGFYYRSAESILESVKPLLYEGVSLYLTDELVSVGAELAIKSTAVYQDGENVIKTSAWAVVDLNKKGMDKAQATGAATSYARKYALGALLLLDDGQDNDAPTEGDIINKIKTTSTIEQLVDLFNKLPENQKTTKIKQACTARRKELQQ